MILSITIGNNIFFLQRQQTSLHSTCRCEMIFLDKISTGRLNILPCMSQSYQKSLLFYSESRH